MRLTLGDLDEISWRARSRGHTRTVEHLVQCAEQVDEHSEAGRARLLVLAAEHAGYAGDHDRALSLYHAAVEDGGPVDPDARCYLAAELLRRGGRAEALELFEQARAASPTDPLLYEFAGSTFEQAEDFATAAWWYTVGHVRCLRDETVPAGEAVMLLHGRYRVRQAQGLPADDLDVLVEESRAGYAEPEPGEPAQPARLSLVYVPAGDWDAFVQRWPYLLEPSFGRDHDEHRREREQVLRKYREQGEHSLSVARMSAQDLVEYSHLHDLDPASSQARARYAAELGRLGLTRSWPPGRNEPCWCGSDTKYKKCCGSPGV